MVTPTGLIPEHEILAKLFRQVLDKDYSRDDYISQFTLRVPEKLSKLDRVVEFHRKNVEKSPEV